MSESNCGNPLRLPPETAQTYHGALLGLREARIPHLIGGAYALAHFTGVIRQTKDFDLFIKPADRDRALEVLGARGYSTRVLFPFWLAKAEQNGHQVDLIYRAPNGIAEVRDSWFGRAVSCEVLGTPAQVCAPEEILITKLFVLNNDRNDLADVMHLFQSGIEQIDWTRLLQLLGAYWRVLLAHLVLFGFVYPSEQRRVPKKIMNELLERLRQEQTEGAALEKVCNGSLLSHSQYRIDIIERGFADGRLEPFGRMTKLDLIDSTISTDDPERPRHIQSALGSG